MYAVWTMHYAVWTLHYAVWTMHHAVWIQQVVRWFSTVGMFGLKASVSTASRDIDLENIWTGGISWVRLTHWRHQLGPFNTLEASVGAALSV